MRLPRKLARQADKADRDSTALVRRTVAAHRKRKATATPAQKDYERQARQMSYDLARNETLSGEALRAAHARAARLYEKAGLTNTDAYNSHKEHAGSSNSLSTAARLRRVQEIAKRVTKKGKKPKPAGPGQKHGHDGRFV